MPRPYFVFEKIQSNSCSLEYGSPSGHALSTSIYLYILFDNTLFKKSNKYYGLYIISILCIGFSRIYLGKHSFN